MKRVMNAAPTRSHQRAYDVHAGTTMRLTYAISVTIPPPPRAISVADSWDRFMRGGPVGRFGRHPIVANEADDQAGGADQAEDSGAEPPAAADVRRPVHVQEHA